MTDTMKARIEKMFRGDAMFAFGFVVALWCAVIFVFFSVKPLMTDSGLSTVLICAGAFVLLFNTAAIVAMVRHYAHEKDFIYGLDIRHLDEMRAAKGK
ncbi:hypothetical protein [Sedimentitalea nanhaiensis]|uniref:Solute:sodium symporter small subunit n=1 Tax=Sedimentitalea nanhaiensis TaxID=999627 RepID=A0A1I7C353_9RHOB|nr:hypothetical protein [Sedimentitalea nanhaiensis]SFT93843.1 hypothetical protein SAMN05216236_11411 [Sedimentitalea nanhaiensis]